MEGVSFQARLSNQDIPNTLKMSVDEIESHVERCMYPASSVTEQKLARSAQAGCKTCAAWSRAIELAKADSESSTVSLYTDRKYEGEFYTIDSPNTDGLQSSQVFYDVFTDSSELT